ncbi:MAG: hypothetical protein Q8L47_01290 [bacterium]|nr:hypothetical protein [bacterium]
MAMTAKEFLQKRKEKKNNKARISFMPAMSVKEFIERMDRGDLIIPADKCAYGGEELHTAITGRNHTSAGDLCDDHYYEILGAIVEEHPIRTFRIRRE